MLSFFYVELCSLRSNKPSEVDMAFQDIRSASSEGVVFVYSVTEYRNQQTLLEWYLKKQKIDPLGKNLFGDGGIPKAPLLSDEKSST